MFYYRGRHGESTTNANRIISGPELNPELTSLGIRQSEDLASRVKTLPVRRIVASSDIRAVQTAEIVNGVLKVELIIVDEYRERDFREWVGRPLPDNLRVLYERNDGMETFEEMRTRFSGLPEIIPGDFWLGHSIATPLHEDYTRNRPMGQNFFRLENCEYRVFEF